MILKKHSDITLITNGIIAHGVNRQLKMGSGVAKALYDRWYLVKSQYLSNNPVPDLGCFDPVVINSDLTIINCYTQENYGYGGQIYADIDAIHLSLILCSEYAIMNKIQHIHIPLIGCDRGGLKWLDVKDVLNQIEQYYDIEFIVHTI